MVITALLSLLDDEATAVMMVASSSGKETQRLQASHHTAPRLIELTTCISRRNWKCVNDGIKDPLILVPSHLR